MEATIDITTKDGQKITLNSANELESADWDKMISLVFNNGQLFHGYIKDIDIDDNDDDIIFLKSHPDQLTMIGLPFNRLLGWYYD